MNKQRVVGAVIIGDGRCLVTLRGPGRGHWEFPGGKVTPGEADEMALAREINEEFGIVVRVGRSLGMSDHGQIRLILYACVVETAREHAEVRWLAADELDLVESWAPADIPFLLAIRNILRGHVGNGRCLFEACLNEGAKVFKQIIEALKDLVPVVNIDFSEHEMSIQAMDSSHVALVDDS